ncbi:MAG: YebC/PmpR family DNA-binding transcriptional regulator [Firmicutes bacterium HGW-Firmicutes-12]|jgi:YebC/PmpR family DNA-binding regulatory protein|nr:MAG: YebC/PmpR family DNA-binding transcriptional regulator [Firmicutes bacterium HGW-Firmicutes-12]
MSGHSKWANIKHRKGKQDAMKGKMFTKLGRELIVAAKTGGPNPDANFRLKIAVQKAKEANMPNDNIQRAIQRGAGGQDNNNYEELTYEGYGPGGVAIMAPALTDNRNRTAGEIRHLFSKYGGNLGETGCVSWMFQDKGILTVAKDGLKMPDDELLLLTLESGAEDINFDNEEVEITTSPENFNQVKEALEAKGIVCENAEISKIPETSIEITDIEQARLLLRLMEYLDEHDDVQNTYTNLDISDEVMEQINS